MFPRNQVLTHLLTTARLEHLALVIAAPMEAQVLEVQMAQRELQMVEPLVLALMHMEAMVGMEDLAVLAFLQGVLVVLMEKVEVLYQP
jgi:hypothetical protein